MWQEDANEMANSVDPDQTAPGSTLFVQTYLPQYLEILWYVQESVYWNRNICANGMELNFTAFNIITAI